jgi:hypothetical protein
MEILRENPHSSCIVTRALDTQLNLAYIQVRGKFRDKLEEILNKVEGS